MLATVLTCITFAASALADSAVCPDITAVSNFDTNAFAGMWFDRFHTPRDSSLGITCDQVKFTAISDTKMAYASFSQSSSANNNILTAFGEITLTHTDKSGKLEGTIQNTSLKNKFRIIATDYTTFAILCSCKSYGAHKKERILVLTRDKHPSSEVLDKAIKILKNNNIPSSSYKPTNGQHQCPQYSFRHGDGVTSLGIWTSMGYLLNI